MYFHIDIGRMPFNLRQKLLLLLIVCAADGSAVLKCYLQKGVFL